MKKLILVDHLGIESENESAYVPPPPSDDDGNEKGDLAIYEKFTEETLSLFEIRRQRMFRVYHELTSSQPGPSETVVHFYRADLRPSIPEFFDFGEVPLLDGIFQKHPDISHVVHLADVPQTPQWGNSAVPRSKDSVKAGRMEGVLEELRLASERGGEDKVPHFVYASSAEVYDTLTPVKEAVNPPPFQEALPITTPSSLRGASKLLEEVLASAYHSAHGIYSVGLRLFDVYGPWSTPGTAVFDVVERVAVENSPAEVTEGDVKDYVFIDDAVDALMAAMQYKSPEGVPAVFNVGTGRGSTLRRVEEEVARHFPKVQNSKVAGAENVRQVAPCIASTERSEALLGFKAQTSLEEGLAHTISWHRDRSLPYGHDPSQTPSLERQSLESALASSLDAQRPKCSPLDRECLRGVPVFPCSSECRREERCTPSAWDDVASLSRAVTSGCDAVLFTILLDKNADRIPSATSAQVDSLAFVGSGLPSDLGRRTAARCNVAFVSEDSPLVSRLRSEGEEYVEEDAGSGLPNLLRHGFWTVLTVKTPEEGGWLHAFSGRYALEYLPKLSPGLFFGSSVRYAAYADPTVLLDDLPKLLKKMEESPSSSGVKRGHHPHRHATTASGPKGSTAMLLSTRRLKCDPFQRGSSCPWSRPPKNDSLQASVYNTIRVALRGQLLGGSLEPTVDTSFVIHSLKEDEARLFRCDAYAEVAQWGASGDERAVEFIVSLHDLWSRAVMHWNESEIWWNNYEESEDEESGERGRYLGVLSSTDVQLFTYIGSSEGMGITHLEDSR